MSTSPALEAVAAAMYGRGTVTKRGTCTDDTARHDRQHALKMTALTLPSSAYRRTEPHDKPLKEKLNRKPPSAKENSKKI